MHSKGNNIEFMSHDNENEVVDELFESLLSKHQIVLEVSMVGRDFIFDLVQILLHKRHKIKFKHGGSYIDSSVWIKKQQW